MNLAPGRAQHFNKKNMGKKIIFQQLALLLIYFITRVLTKFIEVDADWPFLFIVVALVFVSLLTFFILHKEEKEAISMALGLTIIFFGICFYIPSEVRTLCFTELGVLTYFPLFFPITFLVILITWFVKRSRKKIIGQLSRSINFMLDLFLLHSGMILAIFVGESFLK